MIEASFDNKALIATMKKLPVKIQNNVMTGAVRASANVVRDEARSRVRKRSGNLKKSIVSIKRKGERNIIRFSVTPSKGGKNNGWYAHFLEFGTVKMGAKPFLRPAIDSKQEESLKAAQEYIAKRIPAEVEKAKQ